MRSVLPLATDRWSGTHMGIGTTGERSVGMAYARVRPTVVVDRYRSSG
jgi:hypothetical protein